MLVISRRRGEEIWIGHGIRLSVGRVTGGRVKLLIDAPADVRVRRGELGCSGAAERPEQAALHQAPSDSL